MTNGFGPQDYTADGMLRVGWLLWLILAFLARHWILLVLGAVSSFVGVRSTPSAGATSDLLSGPWFLLASLPALALLAAWVTASWPGSTSCTSSVGCSTCTSSSICCARGASPCALPTFQHFTRKMSNLDEAPKPVRMSRPGLVAVPGAPCGNGPDC